MLFFVLPALAGRRPLFPYRVGKGLSGSNEGENPFRLLRGSRCPLDKLLDSNREWRFLQSVMI